MKSLDYEIKFGKHIAFKHKDKQRFTRSKTIGINYSENSIRERINSTEKEIDKLVNKSRVKAKNSKAYEHWATNKNLKIMSDVVVEMKSIGIKTQTDFESKIKELESSMSDIKNTFSKLNDEEKAIKILTKHIKVCISRKNHYDGYKKNTNDKIYYMMNKKDIQMYKKSFNEIKKLCTKYPSLKNIVSKNIHDKSVFKKLNSQLDTLQTQKEKLIKDHKKLDKELKNINIMYDNYLEYIGVSRDGKESIIRKIEDFKEKNKDRKVGKDEWIL